MSYFYSGDDRYIIEELKKGRLDRFDEVMLYVSGTAVIQDFADELKTGNLGPCEAIPS
jgi:hypothetical protein